MSEQPSTSPPPTGDGSVAGPTPQKIGIRFVKAYYQTLSTTPDQIFKFYKPSSILSHGEGSTPTSATSFESYQLGERWGDAQRFDFDNGAIDAQPSANGSILLVVTGHVVVKVDEEETRKGFVHTFLLALVSLPNKQKTYYVHNDVLRFLKVDTSVTETVTTTTLEVETKTVETPATVDAAPKEEVIQQESPSGGVEETKEEITEEVLEVEESKPVPAIDEKVELVPLEAPEPVVEQKKKGESEGGKGKRQRGRGKSPAQPNSQKQQPAAKPTPGSWASLVASGSGTTPAPTPTKAAPPEKNGAPTPAPAKVSSNAQQKKEQKNENSNAKETGKGGKDKPKRDPDNTLVIKNLPDGTNESDLLAIFETFATQTNAKIVSSTISSHRGLAFVDYDSVAPVLAAVEQHGKEPLQLNGRVLEVDQKTAEQKARKARGGGYRSGSPNQNNRGGGGRQNKNKGSSGRSGNKGGRGGGGGAR
eukprot:scaffold10490_cov129-Cylindrotheca_fusiformis.AAC.6